MGALISNLNLLWGCRQRKISHRKVIIHDNGEICAKTYNQRWPHEDDPNHDDPPMLHEVEGRQHMRAPSLWLACARFFTYLLTDNVSKLYMVGKADLLNYSF